MSNQRKNKQHNVAVDGVCTDSDLTLPNGINVYGMARLQARLIHTMLNQKGDVVRQALEQMEELYRLWESECLCDISEQPSLTFQNQLCLCLEALYRILAFISPKDGDAIKNRIRYILNMDKVSNDKELNNQLGE